MIDYPAYCPHVQPPASKKEGSLASLATPKNSNQLVRNDLPESRMNILTGQDYGIWNLINFTPPFPAFNHSFLITPTLHISGRFKADVFLIRLRMKAEACWAF
jgi:hypothetical protein